MPGYGINLIGGRAPHAPSSVRLVLTNPSGFFIQLFYIEPVINYCGGILLQGFTDFQKSEMQAWKASIREAIEWYLSRSNSSILYCLFLTTRQPIWTTFFRELGWYFSKQFINPNTGNQIYFITSLNLYDDEANRK